MCRMRIVALQAVGTVRLPITTTSAWQVAILCVFEAKTTRIMGGVGFVARRSRRLLYPDISANANFLIHVLVLQTPRATPIIFCHCQPISSRSPLVHLPRNIVPPFVDHQCRCRTLSLSPQLGSPLFSIPTTSRIGPTQTPIQISNGGSRPSRGLIAARVISSIDMHASSFYSNPCRGGCFATTLPPALDLAFAAYASQHILQQATKCLLCFTTITRAPSAQVM